MGWDVYYGSRLIASRLSTKVIEDLKDAVREASDGNSQFIQLVSDEGGTVELWLSPGVHLSFEPSLLAVGESDRPAD